MDRLEGMWRRIGIITGAGVLFGAFVIHPLAALSEAYGAGAPVMDAVMKSYTPPSLGLLLFHLALGAGLGITVALVAERLFLRRLDQEHRENDLERQVLEAQRSEALAHLSRGVAHDVNNLLSAINTHLYVAQSQLDEDHAAHAAVEKAAQVTQKAGELPKRLLAFAKGESDTSSITDLAEATRPSGA